MPKPTAFLSLPLIRGSLQALQRLAARWNGAATEPASTAPTHVHTLAEAVEGEKRRAEALFRQLEACDEPIRQITMAVLDSRFHSPALGYRLVQEARRKLSARPDLASHWAELAVALARERLKAEPEERLTWDVFAWAHLHLAQSRRSFEDLEPARESMAEARAAADKGTGDEELFAWLRFERALLALQMGIAGPLELAQAAEAERAFGSLGKHGAAHAARLLSHLLNGGDAGDEATALALTALGSPASLARDLTASCRAGDLVGAADALHEIRLAAEAPPPASAGPLAHGATA